MKQQKNQEEITADDGYKSSIREAALERAACRRKRHQQRSIIIRGLSVITGAILGLISLPLLVVLPEVGLPIALIGLRLLALEYEWAVKVEAWLQWQALNLRNWFNRQSIYIKATLLLIIGIVFGFFILWLFL